MSFRTSALGRAFSRLGYNKDVDTVIAESRKEGGLAKTLTARDLVTLGVAGIIGGGIFVLVGGGTAQAGVAVVPSFIVAALICVVAGYAYAELAATIPASGSAYAYLYTSLGELPGWLVAWALVLEYAVGAISVAIAWRNNLLALIDQILRLADVRDTSLFVDPDRKWLYLVTHSALEKVEGMGHGLIDVPAMIIVLLCTLLLIKGTKESARVTTVLVFIKVAILLLAIGVGFTLFDMDNITQDGLPPEAEGSIGKTVTAVFAAAAIMFFAYIGFDSVSTTAEETKNPKRDLPIGILGSLGITTVLYILAAVALVGMANWQVFTGDSQAATQARGEPFGYLFEENDVQWAAVLVRIGALIGTTSVLLVLILGGVRVFFNMSRDGLLPGWMNSVSKRGSPAKTTLLYGGVTLVFAGFLDLGKAVELVNIGTLFAFVMVIVAAWVFRLRRPDIQRPFKSPMWSIITANGKPYLPMFGLLGIAGIAFMVSTLQTFTLIAAVSWTGLGLIVYALYGIRHSKEAHARHGGVALPDPFTGGRPAADLGGAQRADAQAKAQVAVAAKKASRGGPYTHKGYTLYAREADGRTLYFFARNTPKSGVASALPNGYEVGENSRTGLPFLRRA